MQLAFKKYRVVKWTAPVVYTLALLFFSSGVLFAQPSFPGYTLSNFINNVAHRPLSHPNADVSFITNNSQMNKGWINLCFVGINSPVRDTLLLTWNQGVLDGPGNDIMIVCLNNSYSGKGDIRLLLSDGTYSASQNINFTTGMLLSSGGNINIEYYNCLALQVTPTETGSYRPAAKPLDIASFYTGPLAVMGVELTNPSAPTPDFLTIAVTQIARLQQGTPPVTHDSTITGCGSVVFNGVTYTASTILTDTLKSISATDSVYVVSHINVISPVVIDSSIVSCSSVLYGGINYSSTTGLSDTIVGSFGCDSVYFLTHIVIQPILPVLHDSTINSCNSVVVGGITYNASTVLRDTSFSYLGCDSIYSALNIRIQPVTPVTHASTINSCNSVAVGGITYNTSTVLRDTSFSYLGCDSIYSVLNIHIQPVTPVTHDSTIKSCGSVQAGGIVYNTSTVLRDTIFSYLGCDSIYTVTHILIQPVTPQVYDSTISSCHSVVYRGITYNRSTVLSNTISSYLGCDSIFQTVHININSVVPGLTDTTVRGCGLVNYLSVLYQQSTQWKDTLHTSLGCDSVYRTVHILVDQPSVMQKDTLIKGCGSVVVNNRVYNSSAAVIDTLKSIAGCDSLYFKKVILVTPNNFVPVLQGSADSVGPGTTVTITAAAPVDFTVLSWQPAPVFPLQQSTWQQFTAQSTVKVSAILRSNEGCVSTANLLITVISKHPEIYFPSAFNPNSVAGNNRFGPVGNLSLVKRYSLSVYNRWGILVFYSTDPLNKWDGTYKGVPQAPGNFVWQAIYWGRALVPVTRSGNLLLL